MSIDLPASLSRALTELGFHALTPVQARSLPVLCDGRDALIQAPTGSGKTLAYGLPLLANLDLSARRPQGLVLCPTRELADQVAHALRQVGRHLEGLRIVVLSGGRPVGTDLVALRHPHLLVATPGRLADHLRRGSFEREGLAHVVVDEADRMLDMGFQEEVEGILGDLPARRQTVLLSATLPDPVRALAARFQSEPVTITLSDEAPPHEVHQALILTPSPDDVLVPLLRAEDPETALVFANFKRVVDLLAARLVQEGLAAAALHGDLSQPDRDAVLARFRNGSVRILVGSDLAARGLDVTGLDLVVNHALPDTLEGYVHRVGRTGRAGRPGRAISLAIGDEPLLAHLTALPRLDPSTLPRPSGRPPPPPVSTLRIGGGRRDRLRPGDVLGALVGEAGLDGGDVGRIEVGERVTFVAVARPQADRARRRLDRGRIKGKRFRVQRLD